MTVLVAAFAAVSFLAVGADPWPENCAEHTACDPRFSQRALDPNDHEGAFALLNMPEVFSSDHYPVEALRERKQGRVRVRIDISTDGRPVGCTVTRSSRVPSLDLATCARVMETGKFKIARDAGGLAKPYKTSLNIAWQVPSTELFRDRRLKWVFPIDATGAAGQCYAEFRPWAATPLPPCPSEIIAMAGSIMASAPDVKLIAGRELVFEEGLLIGEPSQVETIGRGSGEQLLKSIGLTIDVGADGKVLACRAVADAASIGEREAAIQKGLCDQQLKRRFMPLAKKDPNRQSRRAAYYFAAYLRRSQGQRPTE